MERGIPGDVEWAEPNVPVVLGYPGGLFLSPLRITEYFLQAVKTETRLF